jgi:hypothetical protein
MRGYVLGAALLAVYVWGYLQTRKLTDNGIAAFYQADSETTVHHDADASCALIADDFRGSSSGVMNGTAIPQETIGKSELCGKQKKFFDMLENFRKRVGRDADVSYGMNFNDPVYAADHRSATVNVSYEYTLLGGHLLSIKGTRVDTLVKRGGKVLLLTSEDHSTGTVGAR